MARRGPEGGLGEDACMNAAGLAGLVVSAVWVYHSMYVLHTKMYTIAGPFHLQLG